MQIDFWINKWNTGDTKFHRADYHPALVKCFPSEPAGTVLVPLCGKSRDMLWLAEKGWKVIGIEASERACRAFFEENAIAFQEDRNGAFTVLRSPDITLWCGDFFAMKREDISTVTACYDRAALVALPDEMRKRYADHLTTLISGPYLLVTMEYPQEQVNGPPFSVNDREVQGLFENAFTLTLLHRHKDTVISSVNDKFKGTIVYENVYLLSKRPS